MVEELRIAPGAEDTTLFTDVSDFVVDRAGRCWVYDRPSNSIFLFDRAGKLLRRIGRQGGGPGEFKSTSGMVALPDSGVAVWDSRNARVSFFSATGDFRTSWRTPAGFSTNNGLVTDRTGALFLKWPLRPPGEGEAVGRLGLVRIHPDGTVSDSLLPPELPVPVVQYFAAHQDKSSRGRSTSTSDFAPRFEWSWHPDGYFVLVDGAKYEIVLGRRGAAPLAIYRDLPKVPVSDQERDEDHAIILYGMRQTDPSWSWNGPAIPKVKAPVRGLYVAGDGRVWIRIAVPSERIPPDELLVPRDQRPIRHYRTPAVHEIFGSNGQFLGRLPLPPRARLVAAEGNTVWALLLTQDDLPAVVRFRVEPGLH